MWNNFCAVVEDLFWFAISGGQLQSSIKTSGVWEGDTPTLPFKRLINALPSPKLTLDVAHTTALHSSKIIPLPAKSGERASADISDTLDESLKVANFPKADILHAPVVMYVSATEGTNCIFSPHLDFDSVIENIPYGAAVTVIGYQGRYASVNRSQITGWILKDDLETQKSRVWPQFSDGVAYDAGHSETVKTRILLADIFGAGALGLPLQAGEYVALRLKSEHRNIIWPRKRPRIAGTWQKLLKGVIGVHIGVTPKTDSIIEWQSDSGEGRLGYIEAVLPDQSIVMTAVGVEVSGYFTTSTLAPEVWRELRPVFIEVA